MYYRLEYEKTPNQITELFIFQTKHISSKDKNVFLPISKRPKANYYHWTKKWIY